MLTTIAATCFSSQAFAAYGVSLFANNTTTTNSGYNRTNAAAWAIKNAEGYVDASPDYTTFGGIGGDCTNFVSRVLKYGGGLGFHGTTGSNVASKDWYYYGSLIPGDGSSGTTTDKTKMRTSSWTGAHQFREHWGALVNSSCVITSGGKFAYEYKRYKIDDAITHFDELYNDLWKGDLIQYSDSSDWTGHSQVIDSYSNGNLYVSQHSDSSGQWKSGLNLKDYITFKKSSGAAYVYIAKIKYASN